MQIRRKEEEMIFPAPSSSSTKHPELHRLSANDQRMRQRGAVPKLYFYREGPRSCEGLKSALRQTLAVFYTLAGRLQERSSEPGGPVDVSCSAQGALFCEAWTDSSLDHAFPFPLQPHPDFHLLLVSHHPHIPLRIQVTHFGCGGMCLCVQSFHVLCDGLASAHFMDSWAETTIGKESLTLYPCFNEAPLEVRYALKAPLDPSCIHFWHKEENIAKPIIASNSSTKISRIFHFTPTFINTLKNSDSHPNAKYTSFECISAYLWKNVIIAQAVPPCEEVCFDFAVDGRKKFDPPLPQGYFGNVVFRARATTLARNLVEKPLPLVADLIKEASKRVNDQYMRTYLHMLGKQDPPIMDTPREALRTLFMSSWKEFPLYKVNFGWGNPFCFRTPPYPGSDDIIVLFPSSLGRGYIDVFVCLDIQHMENLETLIHQAPIGGVP